jgi:CRP/FNR family transcriptional regulator, cyclic AMP receptor protein
MSRSERRALQERVERWQTLPLFAGCSRRQLAQVDGLGATVHVDRGKVLTVEGTAGRQCFIVVSGAASAHRGGVALGTVAGGTVAGELSLLDRTTRTATVVADTPMRLVVLTSTEFSDLLDVAPCIHDRVHEVAARRRTALAMHQAHKETK